MRIYRFSWNHKKIEVFSYVCSLAFDWVPIWFTIGKYIIEGLAYFLKNLVHWQACFIHDVSFPSNLHALLAVTDVRDIILYYVTFHVIFLKCEANILVFQLPSSKSAS